jgi:hypothetical protein
MPIVNLKEILATGYVDNLVVGETLIMQQANDPAAEGLFMRVNEFGEVVGYRAPNQDLEWKQSISTDLTLSDTEQQVIDLTVDHDVTEDNGSWAFVCKIENGSNNREDNVTLTFKDQNDNLLGTKNLTINKGATAYPVTFFEPFKQDFVSGTTFKIMATSERDSIIKGSLTPTTLKIIEARAAAV